MENEGEFPSFPQLPTDVIMDIFIHLPARSVGRFRTLSKLYNSLLSQPLFKKNHLKHGGGISSTKLLVAIKNSQANESNTYTYTLDGSNANNSSCKIVEDSVSLIGSCNGICCVRGSENVLTLWNPTTKETTCLLDLPEQAKNRFRCNSWTPHYGFGYDSLNEDYKIVCVFIGLFTFCSRTETYMYSHKKGCWNKIEWFPPMVVLSVSSHFVHGNIHWWPALRARDEKSEKESQSPLGILSMDLANERYGMLSKPASYCHHEGDDEKICVLGGELCFYIQSKCKFDRGFEIWMMRKYGDEQSWFQLLTISSHNLRRCYGGTLSYIPLFLMKSGEILLWATEQSGSSTYMYNPKICNKVINVHTFSKSRGDLFLEHIYVESLVETSVSKKTKDLLF